MDAGECLNYIGEKMLHAIFAWGIGKAGQRRMRRKLGSWIRTTGMNIRRRKRCITRNIARRKLNVKCVSVELGNAIGQDIWWVGSICWGAVVEKLMVMWGVGKDEMKGKHVLPTTLLYTKVFSCLFSIPWILSSWTPPWIRFASHHPMLHHFARVLSSTSRPAKIRPFKLAEGTGKDKRKRDASASKWGASWEASNFCGRNCLMISRRNTVVLLHFP